MKLAQRRRAIPIFVAVLGASSPGTALTEEKLTALKAELESLVVVEGCAVDADCKALGYGSKPCGGFRDYLVFSSEPTDEDELRTKIDQFNKADRKNNQAKQLMSDCSAVLEPKVRCVDSRCVKGDAARAKSKISGAQ